MTARPLATDYQAATLSTLRVLGLAEVSAVAKVLLTGTSTAQRYLNRCFQRGLVSRYWDANRRAFVYHLPIPEYRFLLTVQGTNSPASAAHCSDLALAAIQAGMPARTAVELATEVWGGTLAAAHVQVGLSYGIEWRAS